MISWWLPLCILFIWTEVTHASVISFHLELTGTRLTLLNTGTSTAFHPTALTLRADGRWQPALSPPGQQAATQVPPGERLELVWPDARPLEALSPVERLRPTMVRFFDQTGVGFGHISLFMPPPSAAALKEAGYVRGALQLAPPSDGTITATWILWPQEEGIEGVRGMFNRDAIQPPAQRIDWRTDAQARRFDTGAAQPAVVLIHETAQGFLLQKVPSGLAGRKQQRAPWLTSSVAFYGIAAVLAAVAVLALSLRWRNRTVAG